MTPRAKRWWKRAALAALLAFLAVILVFETGLANRWMRREVIAQIEKMTGGEVELRDFRFHPWSLRAELRELTIHGREPAGTPPFFHTDFLLVDLRIVSFFGRRIALDQLRLDRPAVHLRFEKDGSNNVPKPKTSQPGKPARERLFDLAIQQMRLNDGVIYWNDVRVPLATEGGAFRFTMEYEAPAPGREAYRCEVSWKQMLVAARRYLPFRSDLAARFTLRRDRFELEEFTWKLPGSELRVSAALESFTRPDWTFRYTGKLDFEDIRVYLRKPSMPGGEAEFSGAGEYRSGKAAARGSFAGRRIALPYRWFHTAGIESRGSYQIRDNRLVVPDFEAKALGGETSGRVELAFQGLEFRAETRSEGLGLAAILAALDHPGFPVAALEWESRVGIEAVTTWKMDFQDLDSRGATTWSAPETTPPGLIPASAHLSFHYAKETKSVELPQGWIATPTSRTEIDGRLGALDSALRAKIHFGELLYWDDFINRLRGRDAVPRRIAGRADWRGTVTGPLAEATLAGHVHAWNAAYDQLYWEEIEGDVSYSPDSLSLLRTRARRGGSTAALSLLLGCSDWEFRAESAWDLDVRLSRTDTDGLQSLFGTSYPARGLLSGEFRGHGTRGEPSLSASFELTDLFARGMHFDRASGELDWSGEEIRITGGEVRKGKGRATGRLVYRQQEEQITFDLGASEVAIEELEPLRNDRLPLRGSLSFQLHGQGPLRAPSAEGTLRLSQLSVGGEVLGDFSARLHSDGRNLSLETTSLMAVGHLDSHIDLVLAGNYPISGEISVQNMDLDPFLQSALRLKDLTGHSRVVGRFLITGTLAGPEGITVEADISDISFDYEYVKLRNVGPVRLTYRAEEVRITSAHLEGPDTNLTFSGFARFARDRQIAMRLSGRVNLRLLSGIWKDLDARGAAEVNASVQGTWLEPRITGHLRVENAAASYGDFPAGLSNVQGEFVFDSNRMVFENLVAEAGGGRLTLSGSLAYGGGPLHYDLNARAAKVRIRYPEGMSWLVGGNLRLQGTPDGALLSGRIEVERLLLLEGWELATIIGDSHATVRGPGVTSSFLRNLQFEIEAVSTPQARVEWGSARFEAEAELRIRGTAEHPILLGHVHLLAGELDFRGNRYRLTRGDMNFSNPFRLDPVIDLEATTTVQQYEVAVQLSGPSSRLTLGYRSDPPLPANDIITLLALGRTSEGSEVQTSPTGGGANLGASALLSEAISSQVGGRIERLFGVSRFRVDPALTGVGAEQNATTRITIEQHLTRDLTVTYVTNVTSTQKEVIQIEYNLSRRLSVLALRDENGTFGLDIRIRRRFK